MSNNQLVGASGGGYAQTYAQTPESASSRIRKTHKRLQSIQKQLITQKNERAPSRQISVTVVSFVAMHNCL